MDDWGVGRTGRVFPAKVGFWFLETKAGIGLVRGGEGLEVCEPVMFVGWICSRGRGVRSGVLWVGVRWVHRATPSEPVDGLQALALMASVCVCLLLIQTNPNPIVVYGFVATAVCYVRSS